MKQLFLLLLCIPALVCAQDKPLVVEGISPNLYLTHTVAPKENYYSIGRMYNISPKEIAPFNKLELEKGLSIGQSVKIPLTEANFFQSGKPAGDESAVVLWHIVKEKEGLYRIALNHNKLPLQTLKEWNNIRTDAVANGTRLVVGYLRVKTDQSPLSARAVSVDNVVAPIASTKTTPEPVVKIAPPVKEIKEDPKPARVPASDKFDDGNTAKPYQNINETPETKPVVINTNKPVDFKGGAFRSLYNEGPGSDALVSQGLGGIFKTTSGWNDGKYYCLYNGAAPNTIVKITSTVTGKSVYAKVLDAMPDIKQNAGIAIRISNAAAGELGVGENNFNCVINYTR